MTWDPKTYDRFADERSQPFFDLLALVEREPGMSVVDLGCGSGRLTAILHDQLGARATIGVDRSTEMLAESAHHVRAGLVFRQGDIATFEGGPFDLVFSNAALHWLDDQEGLLARLSDLIAPSGQLAVQVPANHDHPSHTVAAELAAEEPYRSALGGYVRSSPVLAPEAYARILDRLGFRRQHVRLQVYAHHLDEPGEVVEWVKGTLLTDYQARLPASLYERFLVDYRARLVPRLDDTRPYFYAFKRILFWARR